MKSLLLLISIIFCSPVFAELNLVITGPKEGFINDPIILSNSESSDNTTLIWIYPDEIKSRIYKCSDNSPQIMFFPKIPGKYDFYLAGTDGEMLSYVSHSITIKNSIEEPEEPDEPTPVPSFKEFKDLSENKSKSLNDNDTRMMLYNALNNQNFGSTIEDSQNNFYKLVTNTLVKRKGEKLDIPWGEDWLLPILKKLQEEYNSENITTTRDYNLALKQIVNGLK